MDRGNANDYTVLGNSVNLAARLVAAAGPGQTFLSDGVYRALSGQGVCDALGEIQLKGFEEPTRAWRLRGLLGETLVATRSSFVGREAELGQFRSILDASDWPKYHPCGDAWWNAAHDIGYTDLRITVKWDGTSTIDAGLKNAVDCAALNDTQLVVSVYPAKPNLIGSSDSAQIGLRELRRARRHRPPARP